MTTSSATISAKLMDFSKYENIPHGTSIRYPSTWNKQELLNNELGMYGGLYLFVQD
jgi:hypothetical protein